MKKKTKKNLTQEIPLYKVQNMRAMVVSQMKKRGIKPYGLAKLTGITEQTLRDFVSGKHQMGDERLAKVFSVLGLEVVESNRNPKRHHEDGSNRKLT